MHKSSPNKMDSSEANNSQEGMYKIEPYNLAHTACKAVPLHWFLGTQFILCWNALDMVSSIKYGSSAITE